MTHRSSRCSADGCICRITTASGVFLALIAAVVSFGHMHELALRHGETSLNATLIPLSVDGMVITARRGSTRRPAGTGNGHRRLLRTRSVRNHAGEALVYEHSGKSCAERVTRRMVRNRSNHPDQCPDLGRHGTRSRRGGRNRRGRNPVPRMSWCSTPNSTGRASRGARLTVIPVPGNSGVGAGRSRRRCHPGGCPRFRCRR